MAFNVIKHTDSKVIGGDFGLITFRNICFLIAFSFIIIV